MKFFTFVGAVVSSIVVGIVVLWLLEPRVEQAGVNFSQWRGSLVELTIPTTVPRAPAVVRIKRTPAYVAVPPPPKVCEWVKVWDRPYTIRTRVSGGVYVTTVRPYHLEWRCTTARR